MELPVQSKVIYIPYNIADERLFGESLYNIVFFTGSFLLFYESVELKK